MSDLLMKAIVFYSSSHLKYEDIPVPDIGSDDVLVKVKICGLCGTDILLRREKNSIPFGHCV